MSIHQFALHPTRKPETCYQRVERFERSDHAQVHEITMEIPAQPLAPAPSPVKSGYRNVGTGPPVDDNPVYQDLAVFSDRPRKVSSNPAA